MKLFTDNNIIGIYDKNADINILMFVHIKSKTMFGILM